MNRRGFLRGLMALGAGIVVVGPSVLADVHRYITPHQQPTLVDTLANLEGLTHDIFVGRVTANVRRESPTAMLFQDLKTGDFRLEGRSMVFSTNLRYPDA